MNSKLKVSALLSLTAILAFSVIAISTMPQAVADRDDDREDRDDLKKKFKKFFKGKPDFFAKINEPNLPDHHNGEKGIAMFWVKGQGDNMKIFYKVILFKIGIPDEFDEHGNGVEPENNRYPHYLWKLHVHPAPFNPETGENEHDASQHYLNIVGPMDDDKLKIKWKVLKGVWDNKDAENSKAHMPLHKTRPPADVVAEMCSGDTDINVHTETHLQIRGYIVPTSNFCNTL